MLKTLQFYISRELLKTFALTAIGLTLTFSLTGGVFNMIRAEVLTAVQMLNLLTLVLPLSLTLTLPVSALFSCAMVYGRLAADNEFDACRASGVNIHRLLLPAFLLSIFTCIFSFFFINYVLPRSIRKVEDIVQKDLQKIVVSALSIQGHFKYGPFVVYSPLPPQTEEGPEGTSVSIDSAAFMRIDLENQQLLQAGVADQVLVDFWTAKTGEPVAQPIMYNVRAFDLEQYRVLSIAEQKIDAMAVPLFNDQKTKWLNLSELLTHRHNPLGLQPVQRQLAGLRTQIRKDLFYKHVVDQLSPPSGVLRLEDKGKLKYEIRAQGAANDPKDYRPLLQQVTVEEHTDGHVREYRADRCNLNVGRGLGSAPPIVQLHLAGKVSFTDSRFPGRRDEKADRDLDPVPMPDEFRARETSINDLDLLGIDRELIGRAIRGKFPANPPPAKIAMSDWANRTRLKTLNEVAEQSLKIVSELHSRMAYSLSVLVMLVLAAALAIIFRGGQLLTAFVISFLPGLLVVVMNIAGRQMSEKPAQHLAGLIVIWAGIGLLALADAVVLSRFLRR